MHAFGSMRQYIGALALTVAAASAAHAQVAWTDWTQTGSNAVFGTLVSGSNTVGVNFSGAYSFAQTSCGTDYWAASTYPATYGANATQAPPGCDIIALNSGGPKTITFSQAVVNPLIALVSWNSQPVVTFSAPLQIVAQGCGYWGCGNIAVSGSAMSASGEAHGTIRLVGTYNQISFTDGSENWHGISVGVESVAVPVTATPEPASLVLMGSGLLGVMGVARRRRRSA